MHAHAESLASLQPTSRRGAGHAATEPSRPAPGLAAPVREAALGLDPGRGIGPAGAHPHERRRQQPQFGVPLGGRVVPQAPAVAIRERLVVPGAPPQRSFHVISGAWSQPAGAEQSRSQSIRIGPSVLITTLPGWTSPWQTTWPAPSRSHCSRPARRASAASMPARAGTSTRSAASTSSVSKSHHGRSRGDAQRVVDRQGVRRDGVDTTDDVAHLAPVDGLRDRDDAFPARHDHVPDRHYIGAGGSRDRNTERNAASRAARPPPRRVPTVSPREGRTGRRRRSRSSRSGAGPGCRAPHWAAAARAASRARTGRPTGDRRRPSSFGDNVSDWHDHDCGAFRRAADVPSCA